MIAWLKLPDRGRQRGYWHNVLMGIDQGIGTWFGIDADETISSYIGRNCYGRWQQRLIDWVFYRVTGQRDHCLKSIEKRFLNKSA